MATPSTVDESAAESLLAEEIADARERLEAVQKNVAALRRRVRRARPLSVPELTAALHLIETLADGGAGS